MTNNIKLLPLALHNFSYAQGWYLFQQEDLDSFLLRHKLSLERLELFNVVRLDQRIMAPPLSLQYIAAGFPEDPTPSLPALDNSLKVWQRDLDKLADLRVAIEMEFCENAEIPATFYEWLRDSEIQALAETLSITVERFRSTVEHGNRAVFRFRGSTDSVLWDQDFGIKDMLGFGTVPK